MRSRVAPVAVGFALPGILLFSAVALPATGFVAWKVAASAGSWWNAGPRYRLSPTSSCLREHGYDVSRIKRGAGDWNFPGIWISRRGDYLMSAYFAPTTAAASNALAGMSVSIGPRRNVATNLEIAGSAEGRALTCLRS
ncbi:MAG TPA: hypothetical protein VGH79_07090 [Gaiellaceae bacterium]|jgi:hypothetical protein